MFEYFCVKNLPVCFWERRFHLAAETVYRRKRTVREACSALLARACHEPQQGRHQIRRPQILKKWWLLWVFSSISLVTARRGLCKTRHAGVRTVLGESYLVFPAFFPAPVGVRASSKRIRACVFRNPSWFPPRALVLQRCFPAPALPVVHLV